MEQIEQLVNAVTFDKSCPNFTTAIKTKYGSAVDTLRFDSAFGSDGHAVYIRSSVGGCEMSIALTTKEAMALACALLAQCHKLHELDAPKAEPTPVPFDAMAHGHLITERAPSDDEQP